MLFTHGLPWAIAAALRSAIRGHRRGLSWRLFCSAIRDGLGGWRLGIARSGPAAPVLAVACARPAFVFRWLASFGMNRIEWRGSSFTLEKGRMIPVAPRAGRG